eukprot:142250-Rhodomonas_salina.2
MALQSWGESERWGCAKPVSRLPCGTSSVTSEDSEKQNGASIVLCDWGRAERERPRDSGSDTSALMC